MAQYFETGVPSNAILDLPDAFSLYWKRRVEAAKNPIERWFRNLEYKRLVKYEKRILPKFKRVLVCSNEDRIYLNELGISNVDLLPNGVNIQTFQPRGEDSIIENRILFTGNMDYAPNVDAVHYFVKDIFPIILESVPNAEFIIAGQRPIKSVLELASDKVKVTGFIENLADEYAKAHVVVSPLRIGAGTQNKVLEALSMNQAVVCSNVGFKGLGISHNDGILMADNPAAFAESVISILQSQELRKKLGETGGNHVRNTFSWTAVSNKLIDHFNSIKQ
jgi:glycosyltransferase involved in cell wall biosynthesis